MNTNYVTIHYKKNQPKPAWKLIARKDDDCGPGLGSSVITIISFILIG